MDAIVAFYFVVGVLFPLVMLVVGGLVGRHREQSHLRDLDQREADFGDLIVTDLRTAPAGVRVQQAVLVVGEVVVATDYFKRWIAKFRLLVGGEVRSFSNTLLRARREARLRMLEQARAQGADLVINVRFITSTVISGASEVVCYGTAVHSRT